MLLIKLFLEKNNVINIIDTLIIINLIYFNSKYFIIKGKKSVYML